MAVTMREVITGARDYLGYPDTGRLSNATMLFRLWDILDYYRGQLNITAQDWLLERWPLTVTPGTDEFVVTAGVGAGGASVGRWVDCFTDDTTGRPDFVRQEVPIATVQDMDLYYIGPRVGTGTPFEPWVATSFAFFTEGGQTKVKVTPQHLVPAQYLFFYEPDRPMPPGFNNSWPLLQNFTNLAKVHLALNCIERLAIKDPTTHKIDNMDELQLLRGTLEPQKAEYTTLFQTYKQQQITDQAGPMIGFATQEEEFEDFVW